MQPFHSMNMEDTLKVSEKLAQLQAQNGHTWIPVYNTNHLVDVKDKKVTDIKTFICGRTGEVRDFPISDYLK